MAKIFAFKDKAQKHLYIGITTLAKAVKITLGPSGKNVVYKKNGLVTVTKNGFEVAEQIFLENSFENMGAKLLIETAKSTYNKVEDGTTTSIVLAEAMFEEGIKLFLTNIDPNKIKKGMGIALNILVKELSRLAIPIKDKEDLFHIAKMAANNDSQIGSILTEAIEAV